MKLTTLYLKDILTLIGLFAVGFGWVLIDQYFLPEIYQRIIAFIIIILTLYWLQFIINKPNRKQVMPYANTIALITVFFAMVVSLIRHVIINHDFSCKSILIWVISAILPYVAGFIYSKQVIHNSFEKLKVHSRIG